MASDGPSKSKFAQWTENGVLATAGWIMVLGVYIGFRSFGIQDPIIGQAFLLVTGLWVGNLTIAQSKRNVVVEDTAKRAEAKADDALLHQAGEDGGDSQ